LSDALAIAWAENLSDVCVDHEYWEEGTLFVDDSRLTIDVGRKLTS